MEMSCEPRARVTCCLIVLTPTKDRMKTSTLVLLVLSATIVLTPLAPVAAAEPEDGKSPPGCITIDTTRTPPQVYYDCDPPVGEGSFP